MGAPTFEGTSRNLTFQMFKTSPQCFEGPPGGPLTFPSGRRVLLQVGKRINDFLVIFYSARKRLLTLKLYLKLFI